VFSGKESAQVQEQTLSVVRVNSRASLFHMFWLIADLNPKEGELKKT